MLLILLLAIVFAAIDIKKTEDLIRDLKTDDGGLAYDMDDA